MTPSKLRRSDHAYEALKELIIQLELPPGSPINEDEMMERLNVGRTPFREACQRLSQEDLVRSIPRRGYFVSNITVNDPLHVFEVRQQLEAFSARLAAERITPEQLANLERFVDSLPEKSKKADFRWNLQADRTIHQLVAEASGNPYLQNILDGLFDVTIRLLYMFHIRVTVVGEELPAYRRIIEALKAHDSEAAESAMRGHLGFNIFDLDHNNAPAARNGALEQD